SIPHDWHGYILIIIYNEFIATESPPSGPRSTVRAANLDEVIEECRSAPHIRQRGGRGAVDVRAAGDELVPVDPGGDGDAWPHASGQGDPRPEAPAIVEDVGPVAVAQAAARGILVGQLDRGIARGRTMARRIGEGRVEELRPRRAEELER